MRSRKAKAPVSFETGALAFKYRRLAVPYFRMGVHTIIGAKRFHFRGRDGIGWYPLALATRQNWFALQAFLEEVNVTVD